MHQAPATVWNAVAETGPLKTGWAEQMFPLPQDVMDRAVQAEVDRLRAETGSDLLPGVYLTVMPLLWEQEAIRNLTAQEGPIGSLPPVESVDDAMAIALGDFPFLTPDEAETLRLMLLAPPQ